jgi:hypothetical protein
MNKRPIYIGFGVALLFLSIIKSVVIGQNAAKSALASAGYDVLGALTLSMTLSVVFFGLAGICFYRAKSKNPSTTSMFTAFMAVGLGALPIVAVIDVMAVLLPLYDLVGTN